MLYKVYQIKPDGEISELAVLADADNHLNIWFKVEDTEDDTWKQQEGIHTFLVKKGDAWSEAVIEYKEPTKSEYGFELTNTDQEFIAGDLLEGTVIEGENGVDTTDLTPVGVTLKATTVNELGYANVKVLAPAVTGVEAGTLQFWAYSADDGKWFDAAVHGWGSGFPIAADYDVTTPIYVFADTAGTYEVTFKLVDLDNESAVIAEKTETITVVAALPEQSTYKLTPTGLAESYTAGNLIDVTGKIQAEINAAVEAAIEGIAPVQVTLATDVLGQTGYDAVRIAPVGAEGSIQLWAKDTSNNWYNINVTGWGDVNGFELPANYDVTTDIYVLSNAAGDYILNIKLVDVSDNAVIAKASGTVKVVGAEERAMIVSPATGKTIEKNATITVTAEGADDLRIMLWAKEIADVEAAIAAYNDKVFSSRTADLIAGGMAITNGDGTFTITINEALINMLKAGTRYEGTTSSTGNYTWSAGDVTTWLITPETEGVLWEEYATWDGEKVDDTLFVYNLGTAEPEPEAAVEPTTGVSPSTEESISEDVAFTFGFKSATGDLQELELDIYLGENAGENRNYADHLGINLPAGSDAVATWADQVVAGYDQLDSKFHALLAAAGYDVSAEADANKAALKQNIFYTAGDNGAGTWTIKLDTAVLGEEAIEFLVAVRDNKGAQWGHNNYTAYPDKVRAFLYNVTLLEPSILTLTVTGPDGTVGVEAADFTVTFKVDHDKDLEYLEIDHNLGKHGSLPSGVDELPEFKLYPNTDNPWSPIGMEEEEADKRKTTATGQGLEATYNTDTRTWTLKFADPVLAQIRTLTAEHTNNEFKIYSLVKDIEGVQSGSMYDGTYETTVITMQTASEPQPEVTFTFTGLDNVIVGTVDFSITTKVTNNGAIADNIPLRYKAVVTKDGSALADQVIKYPEATDDREDPSTWSSFTTDSNGTVCFGPSTGFTLTQLQALLSAEGVTTPFQADFAAGEYSVTVSLLDISGEEVELGSGEKTFILTDSES